MWRFRPTLDPVIKMWLMLKPESTTTLEGLCDEALAAIVNELTAAGYTIDDERCTKHPTDTGWQHTAAIDATEPNNGHLLVRAKWGNTLDIELSGWSFGENASHFDSYNTALWDKLESLRQRLVATHNLEDLGPLSDPGSIIGQTGPLGT